MDAVRLLPLSFISFALPSKMICGDHGALSWIPFQLVLSCVVLYVCVGLLACHALGYQVFFLQSLVCCTAYFQNSCILFLFCCSDLPPQVVFMKVLLLSQGSLLHFVFCNDMSHVSASLVASAAVRRQQFNVYWLGLSPCLFLLSGWFSMRPTVVFFAVARHWRSSNIHSRVPSS